MVLVPLLVLALSAKPTPTPGPNTPPRRENAASEARAGHSPERPSEEKSPLLGQWESVVRTPEGVGNILEFYADGRVTQISASMAEAEYRVVGDRLITRWKDLATGKESEVETHVEFEGPDRFLEKSDDNSGDTWSDRIGEAPRTGSPIVGKWCFLFLETLTSYREFTQDRMYNRLPVVTLRGRYSVAGDRLTVTMQAQPPGEYPFRFDNGELVIKSRNGEDRRYKRPETTLFEGY